MRHALHALLLAPLLVSCTGIPERDTLAELHQMEPDMSEVRVEDSLDQAIAGYRKYLEEAPKSALTPEAMRRLADLKLEKEYGILGGEGIRELPAPQTSRSSGRAEEASERPQASGIADVSESEADFERRATASEFISSDEAGSDLDLPGGGSAKEKGPLEAIELYDEILTSYPDYPHNDQVLYQKARAFDELGRVEEAVAVIDRLIAEYPDSRHIDEVHFRRAEYFFVRRKWLDAEQSYLAITRIGDRSEYYELALYKLGWTFYKQEMHEEALHQYVALLDYKVSTGYDFDQTEDEADERRIADTFRVVSLSFSSLGGPDSVRDYFATNGRRSYEDRVYSHLGEFYLEKLRYHDAAESYQTFVELEPLHPSSPHFSMRVVEIYEKGGFPKLVLESKKDFASRYGLDSEYWRHHPVENSPEVLDYLRSNLNDLASHYHALYQEEELAEEKPANFAEAVSWYRSYLSSFPDEAETPAIHYRLADLMLENEDFREAATEYEHIAYDYPAHEQSAGAGYAAIYAHRQNEKSLSGAEREAARREAVTSTLRFVDVFPEHEHAASVLGAAVDDLYEMQEHEKAIATGRQLIEDYPDAELPIRRDAWSVVAHSSFELTDYPGAEQAYARVLDMTERDDEKWQGVVDNLAAAIYKQGEQASEAGDHRAAADHFLRIARVAPASEIRPAAEYDAGVALIELEAWDEAARVYDAFRSSYPEHELYKEATRQIAYVYREAGDFSRAAGEYERVADEAEDPEMRSGALLLAGELYEDSESSDEALAVYLRYVEDFPEPIETAVETRFKIAEMYEAAGDEDGRRAQLREIVAAHHGAGGTSTDRVRYLAARSDLVLTTDHFDRFVEIQLVQPFEKSLARKQQSMNSALEAFGRLVDYEVGEVTAAATFYMAQIYADFSRSLMESERPEGLTEAELTDYEIVLEEEAYPFEERAIEVHEKNLELMAAGVWNDWIEKSLARLAVMMPGRYAKAEVSSGWLSSIDRYAYRSPAAPEPMAAQLGEAAPETGTTEATGSGPTPANASQAAAVEGTPEPAEPQPTGTAAEVREVAPTGTAAEVREVAPADTADEVREVAPADTADEVREVAPAELASEPSDPAPPAAPADTADEVREVAPADTADGVREVAPADTADEVREVAPAELASEPSDPAPPAAPAEGDAAQDEPSTDADAPAEDEPSTDADTPAGDEPNTDADAPAEDDAAEISQPTGDEAAQPSGAALSVDGGADASPEPDAPGEPARAAEGGV